VSFSTLLDYDFVGLDDSTAIVRLLSDQAAVAMKPLRLRVQVKAFASQCRMIESGLGVGVLPEGAARPFVGALKLRMLQLADLWAVRKMYVCVRDYDLLPAIAKRLVDHLSKR
jgi:DNA-binding transcriptional LysR family regulator